MASNKLSDIELIAKTTTTWFMQLEAWFQNYVFSMSSLIQGSWLVGSLIAGMLLVKLISPFINDMKDAYKSRWALLLVDAIASILTPLFSLVFMAIYPYVADYLGAGLSLSRLFQNLLAAWVVIRFASSFIRYPKLARWLAIIIWSIAALNTFGWLEPAISQMDHIGFSVGDKKRITMLTIIKGLFAFAFVMWVATVLSRIGERQVQSITQLTPSLRVLISKMIRTVFIVFAAIIGLNTLGIDLTSLAVFSGAIGVGIGFGLQKVVSNFISGIILLLDRSIKPGDVIAIDQTYGWVNKLSARHVSVITRDGKEHLIPNELLITEQVENWSYSDRNVRLKIPVGVSYHCDVRAALKLMLEAAAETPRILKSPKPNALMIGMGDNSINLELRAWIDDPANGISNISSDLLLNIWDKFKANDIGVPFPQRDIHVIEPISVKLEKA